MKVCPITDIRFVEKADIESFRGSHVGLQYTELAFNKTTSLLFTKNAPNLPLTSTQVEYEPCMDPFYHSTTGGDGVKLRGSKYFAEVMLDADCMREVNSGLVYDPRYTESGLNTN